MKKFSILCLSAMISIFTFMPSMVSPQVPLGLATSEGVTEEEVRHFIDEYVNRFIKLDLEAFMALFSERAVENRILPYADIHQAYQKTIQLSRSIQYKVRILTIQTFPESAFVSGRYRLMQAFRRGGAREFQGSIQWLMIRQDRELKIREINYGIDP